MREVQRTPVRQSASAPLAVIANDVFGPVHGVIVASVGPHRGEVLSVGSLHRQLLARAGP